MPAKKPPRKPASRRRARSPARTEPGRADAAQAERSGEPKTREGSGVRRRPADPTPGGGARGQTARADAASPPVDRDPSRDRHPDDHVVMARLGAPHGVRGEVRLIVFAEDPARLRDYNPFMAPTGEAFTLTGLRPVGSSLVARFAEIGDRDIAATHTNKTLAIPRERLPALADPDEFYENDLVGLRAERPAGQPVGTVTGVFDFGAGTLIEVRLSAGGEVLVPFTSAAVPSIDVAGGRLVMDPPAGLLDDPPASAGAAQSAPDPDAPQEADDGT